MPSMRVISRRKSSADLPRHPAEMACVLGHVIVCSFVFFFNDTATTEIYTLSLHDALPIRPPIRTPRPIWRHVAAARFTEVEEHRPGDRKSTRLNSSHVKISYAVFCLK